MIPLIVLTATYLFAGLLWRGRAERVLPQGLALAAMLVFTGAAHFTAEEELVAMVPSWFPAPRVLVGATGVAELAFAVLLVVLPTRAQGFALAALFAALLPANVHSAVAEVGVGGHGASSLWFRVPLQALFVAWALSCTGAAGRRGPKAAGATPRQRRNGGDSR